MLSILYVSITGKIVGIKEITTVTACSSCGKSVQPYQDSTTLGQCQASNCNLIQILNSCDFNWSMRLVIKASDDSKRNIMLYHQQLLQLLMTLILYLLRNSPFQYYKRTQKCKSVMKEATINW